MPTGKRDANFESIPSVDQTSLMEIFISAFDDSTGSARLPPLHPACSDEFALRKRVEALLAAAARAASFLDVWLAGFAEPTKLESIPIRELFVSEIRPEKLRTAIRLQSGPYSVAMSRHPSTTAVTPSVRRAQSVPLIFFKPLQLYPQAANLLVESFYGNCVPFGFRFLPRSTNGIQSASRASEKRTLPNMNLCRINGESAR